MTSLTSHKTKLLCLTGGNDSLNRQDRSVSVAGMEAVTIGIDAEWQMIMLFHLERMRMMTVDLGKCGGERWGVVMNSIMGLGCEMAQRAPQ